jgi:hypothetical protein
MAGWILLKNWLRGKRVEWKGREHRVRGAE